MTPPQKAMTAEERIEAMAESMSQHTVSFKAAKACLGSLVQQARAEGFAQAREMGAKEADLAPGTNGRFIAKKIRALECPKEAK